MLRYLGVGPRRFDLHPLKPLVRMNWEFFAVVKGRCAPLHDGRAHTPPTAQTLWITSPGSAHTWTGGSQYPVHVVVFHFGSVPAALETLVRERGQVAVKLRPGECRRLVALAGELQRDFHRPNDLSHLVFDAALIELSLLVLRKAVPERLPPLDPKARTVEDAIDWFSAHVRSNPTISDVAHEVHVSPSTLRRLFRRTQREQPTRVFKRIQVELGMRLMATTAFKLDSIAEQCGFTSTSDFCRAFKAFTKVTPRVWRETFLARPLAAQIMESATSRRPHLLDRSRL